MAFGTVFTLDGVDQLNAVTVVDIGEDHLWENLDAFFRAHNTLFNEVASQIAERTTDRQRQFGDVAEVESQELDEFGAPDAQKITPEPYNLGFPLRLFGYGLQWTRFAFEVMSAEEFTKQVNAITDADEQQMYRQIRRAIFRPTNYTFRDWQELPNLNLDVKALLNADGQPIPTSPNTLTFDGSTHTHYLGVTTGGAPTQAEFQTLIGTVREHFISGSVEVWINQQEEADVRGFADFKEYIDARLVNQTTEIVATGNLSLMNTFNRPIGLLDGAEIHVKPWIPAGYVFATVMGQERPLVERIPNVASARGLRLMAEDERHPLRARSWEHRFGFAAWNRINGAVLDTVTGGGTYTEPAI